MIRLQHISIIIAGEMAALVALQKKEKKKKNE